MVEIKDQVAQVAVQRGGVGPVLPQNGQHLAVGAGSTVAVHQIGQQLLALAALEGQRAAAHKDLKVAEALNFDACGGFGGRVAQICQHGAHIGLADRFEQKAAHEHLQRFQRILRVRGGHDQVAAGLQFLQRACHGKAPHARHFQVQEGRVQRATARQAQGVGGGRGAEVFAAGCGAAQGACQRAGGLLPILHNKYLHLDPLRITARCPGRSTRLLFVSLPCRPVIGKRPAAKSPGSSEGVQAAGVCFPFI